MRFAAAEFAHQAIELRILGASRQRPGGGTSRCIAAGDALDISLRSQQSVFDAGTRTGIIEIGHGALRIFDGDLQGGAELMAIERAMAQLVGPFGRAEAIVALALRIEIAVAMGRAEGNRQIGVALARGKAVAKPGDQQIAHRRIDDDRLLAHDIDRYLGTSRIGECDVRSADPFVTGRLGHQCAADPPLATRRLGQNPTLGGGEPEFDAMFFGIEIGLDAATRRMCAFLSIVAKSILALGGPAAPVEILAQNGAEGDEAIIQHMLRADDRGSGDVGVALVLAQVASIDMEQILPPRIPVQLEELRIAEQPEAVYHLPFDAELAGAEGLSPGRQHEATKNQDGDEHESEHGGGFNRLNPAKFRQAQRRRAR